VITKARDHDAHVLVITDGDELLAVGPTIQKLRNYGSVSALGYQSLNRITLQNIAHYGGGELHLVDDEGGLVDALLDESVTPEAREMAVVLVLDRSASMQGPKLEAIKEMARIGVEVLSPDDTIGVVAFDTEASVVVSPQRASNRMRISSEIMRITSGGGTDVLPALTLARDMFADLPRRVLKHVIVLSDGESPPDGVVALVDEMRAANITVSAIGIEGADRDLLDAIAQHGKGRLYIGVDIGQLPKLFLSTVGRYPPRNR
jgi:Mg-chelatase subunit ChlD